MLIKGIVQHFVNYACPLSGGQLNKKINTTHTYICLLSIELHKDMKKKQLVCMALSEGNKTCLSAHLKVTNTYYILFI